MLSNRYIFESAKILAHRSGTEYEDITFLDARTGAMIVTNITASGKNKFKSGLTREEKDFLDSKNVDFEILHNHPGSSQPSRADIIGLFQRSRAKASTVVGHDGKIYRMEKLKPYPKIVDVSNFMYNKSGHEYSFEPENLVENHATEELIKFLVSNGYLRYTVR